MHRSQLISWRRRPEAVLGWFLTACVVVAVYGAVLVVGGLASMTEEPPLVLSVVATVAVAAVIGPVQQRCEALAARMLHGDRQTPYDVLSRFTSQVGSDASPDLLPQRMARLLAEGTASAWAQVWVLVNDRLTLMATHPADADADPDPPVMGATRRPGQRRGQRTVTVGYQGQLLGMLRVQERAGRPLTPVEERLFAGLAAQAGLALHSAQVRAELQARHQELTRRTEELRVARDELVCVQDQERRRLERDIHDGAQQQLVALTINLRLAQTLAARSPERAVAVLGAQEQGAAAAIDTLWSLSRGVQPRVLREEGLAPALRLVAESSPLPVRLTTATTSAPDRLHPDIEAALYFCGLEALQNAVKHARASAVEIRLLVGPRRTELTVADDGTGITAAPRGGTGLANIRDRVSALGGSVRVDSAAGAGTRVVASVPTRAAAR